MRKDGKDKRRNKALKIFKAAGKRKHKKYM
jgi:hypothetical protein